MIYKVTSSREIVAKIFADLDIKEDSQRTSDILEWISEAVEKIGAVTQLRRVVSGSDGEGYLEIVGHQAQLPIDLHRLNQVMYSTSMNGPWVPIERSTGNFNAWPSFDSSMTATGGDRIISDMVLVDSVKILYQKYVEDPIYSWFSRMDTETALEILNTNANVRTLLTNLINAAGSSSGQMSTGVLKYSIKPGYIMTNMPVGYLKLSYDALLRDDDGYLLIPDLASYKEAVYWYVVMKLKYPEYMNGRMNREIYYDIRRSWNFYCKQAYGDAMMPDQDDMENIGNVWNRLVPQSRDRSSGYENIAEVERIYNAH